jgi:hypothetical protein
MFVISKTKGVPVQSFQLSLMFVVKQGVYPRVEYTEGASIELALGLAHKH